MIKYEILKELELIAEKQQELAGRNYSISLGSA